MKGQQGIKVSRQSLFNDDSDEDLNDTQIGSIDLYNKLASAIQANIEVDESPDVPAIIADQSDDAPSEDELEAPMFRLFSTKVQNIVTEAGPQVNAVRGDDYYEAQEDEEMYQRFSSAAITIEDINNQSKVPWVRHFFSHKVMVLKHEPEVAKPNLTKSKKLRIKLKQKKEQKKLDAKYKLEQAIKWSSRNKRSFRSRK